MTEQQQSFFDPERGTFLRDVAIAQVEEHAPPTWLEEADRAITLLARARDRFTTDAVWALLDRWGVPPPHEKKAMGAAMRAAARDLVIEATNETSLSQRAPCHRRPLRVWQSLGFGRRAGQTSGR